MSSVICYRCGFEIQDVSKSHDGWEIVIKLVRKWISRQLRRADCNAEELGQAWFWKGGERKLATVLIKTALCDTGNNKNNAWAVEVIQTDKDNAFRQWKTSMCLHQIAVERFIFQIQNEYEIVSNYVGPEIPPPVPTVPWIVSSIIDNKNLSCMSGKYPIQAQPIALKFLDAGSFQDHLFSSEKTLPFILITPERTTGEYWVDPTVLAYKLKGAAQVFYTENNNQLVEEFRETLGRRFFSYDGAIRIYFPDVDNHADKAYKKHRFVRKSDFMDSSAESIINVLINVITRKNLSLYRKYPISVTDVISLIKKLKLQSLIENARNASELERYACEDNQRLSTENENLRDDLLEKEYEIENLKAEKVKLQQKINNLNSALKSKNTDSPDRKIFDTFPTSLQSVFDWFIAINPGKIAITVRGMASLQKSNFKDYPLFWKALNTLLFLWDVGSGIRKSKDLIHDFKNETGLELSLSETKSTSQNGKLARLRADNFENIQIDITKHVKVDDNTTRIYYDFIPSRKLLVIGYIGHLDTAGTRIHAKK